MCVCVSHWGSWVPPWPWCSCCRLSRAWWPTRSERWRGGHCCTAPLFRAPPSRAPSCAPSLCSAGTHRETHTGKMIWKCNFVLKSADQTEPELLLPYISIINTAHYEYSLSYHVLLFTPFQGSFPRYFENKTKYHCVNLTIWQLCNLFYKTNGNSQARGCASMFLQNARQRGLGQMGMSVPAVIAMGVCFILHFNLTILTHTTLSTRLHAGQESDFSSLYGEKRSPTFRKHGKLGIRCKIQTLSSRAYSILTAREWHDFISPA